MTTSTLDADDAAAAVSRRSRPHAMDAKPTLSPESPQGRTDVRWREIEWVEPTFDESAVAEIDDARSRAPRRGRSRDTGAPPWRGSLERLADPARQRAKKLDS